MPDLMTVIVPSLIAIALMVGLIRLTGLAHPVVLDDESLVRDAIDEHFEGMPIERIILGQDGQCALVVMSTGAPALVRAMGDRMVVRRLTSNMVKAVSGKDTVLNLKLRDFTWPRARMVFENTTARANAQDLIESRIADKREAMAHA
ncbi:MAG: hypothetical protein Q9M33_10425 [Robiginitomaculum sp.]|nr:hypothetical protein [Robiginitomaculum sp.]MDQ7078459.1 hypothetical protein [Robiginitomaculum sp.]